MKKLNLIAFFVIALTGWANAQTKLEQDRAAIKGLAGFFKVTFDYAETFAPSTAYKYHDRYSADASEWALITEDSPKKIVIQHLLVIGDSSVIKHWREDWVYEAPEMLAYDKDNAWKLVHLKPEETKGRWVQKVFQVDDSPRYEGIGTWVHVDGRHEWHSEADSPLPRREATHRSDYNVLRRGNRIYLTANGYMFEQDNKKIIRSATGDKLLVQEKGYEEFTKTDAKEFAYAQKWWNQQQSYWTDVRLIWDDVLTKHPVVKLQTKKDGKLLYERLFSLGDQSAKEKWSSAKNKEEVNKVLNDYLASI